MSQLNLRHPEKCSPLKHWLPLLGRERCRLNDGWSEEGAILSSFLGLSVVVFFCFTLPGAEFEQQGLGEGQAALARDISQ